jgi:hypothetical protein
MRKRRNKRPGDRGKTERQNMKNQIARNTTNKPVHTLRHGFISASVWRQDTDKGPMFNVTFQRSYKEGDDWKHSTSFGRSNLLVVALLATRAYEWIAGQPKPRRT